MAFAKVNLILLEGFGITCLIFVLTLVMAIPLGLLISFGSMSKLKPLKYFVKGVVWVVRGTPLMLQVIVVFYGPGLFFNTPISSRLAAVVVAFVFNYACYFSEIYRGGIESISVGQYEAGKVLGLSKSQIFFKVVLFQVVKRILPPMSNEVITLVKDTSLARVIAVEELTRVANQIVNVYGIIWPLFYAGLFYLIFNGILSVLFSKLEKKLDYYKG